MQRKCNAMRGMPGCCTRLNPIRLRRATGCNAEVKMIVEVDALKEIEGGKFFPVSDWKGGRWVGLTRVEVGRCPNCKRRCRFWIVDPEVLSVGCPDCALSLKDWMDWQSKRRGGVAVDDLKRLTRIFKGRR